MYTSYICILWGVFVSVCQLPAGVFSSPSGRLGWVFFPQGTARRANIPPSSGWPSNWGILARGRPSASAGEADGCSAPLLFWFGSGKRRRSPAAWCRGHSSPNTEVGKGGAAAGKDDGGREGERRAGHFSPLMTMVVKSNLLEKDEHTTQKMMCSNLKFW